MSDAASVPPSPSGRAVTSINALKREWTTTYLRGVAQLLPATPGHDASVLLPNLLPYQRALLDDLQSSEHHIVFPSDRNLGPAIIERDEYVRRAFSGHLSDTSTYRQLTQSGAEAAIVDLQGTLAEFFDDISDSDFTFLERSLSQNKDPFSYFYLLAKVHKSPWKTGPIVSYSGSLLHGLGRWVDKQLQPMVKQLPWFVSSSAQFKELILEATFDSS